MARHVFGEPISEDDVLVVQGIEYPMLPVGMRAMRRMLTLRDQVAKERGEDDPVSEADLDVALDIVLGAVKPDVREAFREHIEDRVPPDLLVGIATAVMGAFSDLDPTEPESSSGGSSTTGSDSTVGALPAPSTPMS